jgi:hypothetical protein
LPLGLILKYRQLHIEMVNTINDIYSDLAFFFVAPIFAACFVTIQATRL